MYKETNKMMPLTKCSQVNMQSIHHCSGEVTTITVIHADS